MTENQEGDIDSDMRQEDVSEKNVGDRVNCRTKVTGPKQLGEKKKV